MGAACPKCGARLGTDAWASYRRHYVHIKDGQVTDTLLDISRLKCPSCGKTHALLPSGAVPYSVFSIRFVALLILDWKDGAFPSIECLCAHYQIATNTFYRIKKRFVACVVLAVGMIGGGGDGTLACARTIAGNPDSADALLSSFFDRVARSFCQGLGP